MEKFQFTRNEKREADQGNNGPEVIPPEYALPKAEDDPTNGNQASNEVEGRG